MSNCLLAQFENDIFKTIDALASKDKKLALFLLHKHLDNGDNALYFFQWLRINLETF